MEDFVVANPIYKTFCYTTQPMKDFVVANDVLIFDQLLYVYLSIFFRSLFFQIIVGFFPSKTGFLSFQAEARADLAKH